VVEQPECVGGAGRASALGSATQCPKFLRDKVTNPLIWWAVLGSDQSPLPCETVVPNLQINHICGEGQVQQPTAI
jgi:hypothetical protein